MTFLRDTLVWATAYFPLVSWVRCGTWLYRFLIFAPLLTWVWGIRDVDPTKSAQMMILDWPWPSLRQVKFDSQCVYMYMGKSWFFLIFLQLLKPTSLYLINMFNIMWHWLSISNNGQDHLLPSSKVAHFWLPYTYLNIFFSVTNRLNEVNVMWKLLKLREGTSLKCS